MNKKIIYTMFSLVLGIIFTPQAHAGWGSVIEHTARGAGKQAARTGSASAINSDLAKQKCTYPDAESTVPSCDLNKIISLLSSFHTSAEASGFANDVDIIANTWAPTQEVAKARAEYLKDKIQSGGINYWDWDVRYDKANRNEAKIRVEVR